MTAASDFRPLDAARDSLIAVQAQLIMVLAERNSALEARIGELEGRLARLERAASRNSANSSMPPSADDLPGKTPPPRKPREGTNGRQGKQPGAPGVNMLIRALVITSAVLCADETPLRVGPGPKTRKKYLLVAC